MTSSINAFLAKEKEDQDNLRGKFRNLRKIGMTNL